jgi:hypothetical protein
MYAPCTHHLRREEFIMKNYPRIDWEAYAVGKRTGLVIGYTEGLKVGIITIAEMKFGPPDTQFLEEIRHMIDPSSLEWILKRLATASSLREVRALYTPPEELTG